jgi:hypothetical protein
MDGALSIRLGAVKARTFCAAALALIFVIAASGLCVLFESDEIAPLPVSLFVAGMAVLWGMFGLRLAPFSPIAKLYIIAYALPFIHCMPYLWFDYSSDPGWMWGLYPNPYMSDEITINAMAMVGCIGALGFVGGLTIMEFWRIDLPKSQPVTSPIQPIPFAFLAFLSLGFSWLSSPRLTMFEAVYTEGGSWLDGINFNGGFVVSYILAALLLIDTQIEQRPRERKMKRLITGILFVVIVVWFQFLRGKRDCVGLIIAFIGIYLVGGTTSSLRRRIPLRKAIWIGAGVAGMFIAGNLVLTFRSIMAGGSFSDVLPTASAGLQRLYSGTWSAVLLTPLSVIGDFRRGLMSQRWGQTYIDYLLSLPPGIVTQTFGIERAIEATHGPAWEMRYGIGGTHATVVPFMNFKSYGVLWAMLTYGLTLGALERWAAARNSPKWRLLYGTAFIIAPFWFWYGEMYAIRAAMVWYLVWTLYRLMPKSAIWGQA